MLYKCRCALYLIAYDFYQMCAENRIPHDHFWCVMVCYPTFTCTPQKTIGLLFINVPTSNILLDPKFSNILKHVLNKNRSGKLELICCYLISMTTLKSCISIEKMAHQPESLKSFMQTSRNIGKNALVSNVLIGQVLSRSVKS